MSSKRIVISGMSVNTLLGDTLDSFYAGLLSGRSTVGPWKFFNTGNVYSKVGADLSGYDVKKKLAELQSTLPPEMFKKLKRLVSRAPWSTQLSLLLTAIAWRDAGLCDAKLDLEQTGVVVAGHNINSNYNFVNRTQFDEEPDYIDGMLALHNLDTDHAAICSELVGAKGPIYTVGAACASGNVALRCAIDEIRYHGYERVLIVGSALDMAPMDLHAMALLGAISYQSFNDAPYAACRPFDTKREGFVPAHGGAVLVVESLESALARGATIHAEVLGSESNADANHLPSPSEEGQTRLMRRLLKTCNIKPEQVDYVNAHATSTPLGDLTEIRSIKNVFGKHAYELKVNATKSMLGHVCWAAATVETVAAIQQMKHGKLHPSINIEELDPEIDLDVCRGKVVEHDVKIFMKNSFGFGGINAVSLFKRWEA
ncbi:MAG TPA: beta-ketoacyl-[acyl-carrier-protein] synthase family protein [Polyangiaceae bacterium]|nr:beta-ketoacyl-[acyl-carrier-protein] synthase family protein [Polyangiaceae bacterium]